MVANWIENKKKNTIVLKTMVVCQVRKNRNLFMEFDLYNEDRKLIEFGFL